MGLSPYYVLANEEDPDFTIKEFYGWLCSKPPSAASQHCDLGQVA